MRLTVAAPGTMDAKERQVPCPACRQPSLYGAANRWRPFCSERCRATDLGAWATESYRVPAQPPADGDDEPEPSPARH